MATTLHFSSPSSHASSPFQRCVSPSLTWASARDSSCWHAGKCLPLSVMFLRFLLPSSKSLPLSPDNYSPVQYSTAVRAESRQCWQECTLSKYSSDQSFSRKLKTTTTHRDITIGPIFWEINNLAHNIRIHDGGD